MCPLRAALLAFLAGTGWLSAAAPPHEAFAPQGAPEPFVGSLISALSSDDYKVREEATLKLWGMGEPILGELAKAAAGDDPEVAFRAAKLVRDIEHFITPDTDPVVIQQVENYRRADRENKPDIFRKIAQKRGWHQLLKLYASEQDPLVLEELRDQAYGAAIIGAREKIAAGKEEEARKFLEMAPRDERSLVALACFHRANGTFAQERLDAAAGPADWRAALARAAGDTGTAAASAREAGDLRLAAAMGLFNGEFLPWLDLFHADEDNPSRKLYMDVIAARWDPQRKEEARNALSVLSSEVTGSRDEESRERAAGKLFLAGYPDLAEAALPKAQMLQAVDYYSTVERYDEALAAFGLTPGAPDFNGWVERKFAVYLNSRRFENDRVQDESSKAEKELQRFVLLLSQLGLNDELRTAFEKPLLAMAESNPEDFLTFLTTLFTAERGPSGEIVPSGAVTLAQAVGAKWAGADEGRWRQLVNLAFSEDEIAIQWWEWTGAMDATASLPDRFAGILGLFGSSPDPARARDHWLGLAWQAVEKATPAQKAQYLKRIGYIVDFSRTDGLYADMATSLKVRTMQEPDDRGSPLHTQSFLGLSMQGKWDEVADLFSQLIAGDDEDTAAANRPDLHAYLAASLRRAGREKDAIAQDVWAEKLALGEPGASINISNGYAFGGDMKRSAEWLARYAIEASPSLEGYEDVFSDYSVRLLEQGRWKESAALAEAMALKASDVDADPSKGALLLDLRLKADLPHALAMLATDRKQALDLLGRCHAFFPGGGRLADYFFPSLRKAGLIKEHDQYFENSWKIMSGLARHFPRSEQTLNGSAWLAARAARRLDEAEALSRKALELNPDQAAYLDTMAEVHFAQKDRKEAMKWSAGAVNFAPGDTQIRRQYERFSNDPFPGD